MNKKNWEERWGEFLNPSSPTGGRAIHLPKMVEADRAKAFIADLLAEKDRMWGEAVMLERNANAIEREKEDAYQLKMMGEVSPQGLHTHSLHRELDGVCRCSCGMREDQLRGAASH